MAGVIALVFAAKLVVMLQLSGHVLTQADAGLDTTAYVALASRVLNGNVSLGPGLYFVSPLYAYFLALLWGASGSFTLVRFVQIALGAGAVALVYAAAREWFGVRAGLFAAVLAGLTGLFTFYESLLIQSALDPCLSAAALASLAFGLRRGSSRWCGAAGVLFGIASLNRPNMVIPAVGLVLLMAALRRPRSTLFFAAGLALALVPVSVRNLAVADDWSPAASHGGLNFYVGNNPSADGTYTPVSGISANLEGQQDDVRRAAEQALGRPVTDREASDYFYRFAWNWIRAQPRAASRLFLRKLWLTFSSASPWLNYSYRFFLHDASTLLPAFFIGPWILMPLGIAGLVIAAPSPTPPDPARSPERRAYLVWASFVPLYGIAVAAFFVADRYTLPLLVPLCVGAGAAVDAGLRLRAARQWKPLAAMLGICLAVGLLANRAPAVDDGVGETRVRMAERLITLGRFDEAEGWAARAEAAHAKPGLVQFRMAQRLIAAGRTSAAIPHLERALALDPHRPEVEFVLGSALLEQSRPGEAVPHLRNAQEAGLWPARTTADLVRALGASGDRAGAASVLSRVRGENDWTAEQWLELGSLAMQLREPARAATFFARAIDIRPDIAMAHFDLAAAEAAMGDRAGARLHVAEALKRDPALEPARRLEDVLR